MYRRCAAYEPAGTTAEMQRDLQAVSPSSLAISAAADNG
jgi:hypothetical protein